MKKITVLFCISIVFLLISVIPLFNIIREFWIEQKINDRYEINHAYQDEQGFRNIIDVQEIRINDMNIKIKEEETGKKAPLTPWDRDENVPPGDIVKLHLLLYEKEITEPDEIWLSNRNRGSRYFSWLDIITVNDRETDEKQVKIVQRLTDDSHPMEDRRWKIITISEVGDSKEELVTYAARSENKLAVKLINFSGTSLMSMGYYSDITKGYPGLIFPFIYPFLTGLVGIVILIICFVLFNKRNGLY